VLFDTGFATHPSASETVSSDRDGSQLRNCRLTNVVRCLPPGNRPGPVEISNCADYLAHELDILWRPRVRSPRVVVALGGIAHRAIVAHQALRPRPRFSHGEVHALDKHLWLIDSYHPSRLNVNTGRITEQMLRNVFEDARAILEGTRPDTAVLDSTALDSTSHATTALDAKLVPA
jgi:uracil-DNA glycosylase family 4